MLDVENYGDEDQNELMQLINKHEGEFPMNRIEEIEKEIDFYRTAAEEAMAACEDAERELVTECEKEYPTV